MSRQIDPAVEQRAIMYALADAQKQIVKWQRKQEALWSAFFKLADELAGEGEPYRFLDEMTGQVLSRQIVVKERLDEERLAALLPPAEWEAVTEPRRHVNALLLEAALLRGEVGREIVAEAVTVKKEARRYGPRPAGRELLEEAAAAAEEETR